MQHAHGFGVVVDDEEDTVCVRLPPVKQYPYRTIGVEALRRFGAALRMLVERQDRAFEAVEPPGDPL